jgi:hypothetical protein
MSGGEEQQRSDNDSLAILMDQRLPSLGNRRLLKFKQAWGDNSLPLKFFGKLIAELEKFASPALVTGSVTNEQHTVAVQNGGLRTGREKRLWTYWI